MVFADDDGKQGPFHACFDLAADGEEVQLVDLERDGTLIDGIRFPGLGVDVAYGRLPDFPESWGYLVTPTAGGPNARPKPIPPQVSVLGRLPLKPKPGEAVQVFIRLWDDGPAQAVLRVLASPGSVVDYPLKQSSTGNPFLVSAEIPPFAKGVTVRYQAIARDEKHEAHDPQDGQWHFYHLGGEPPKVVINEVMADNDSVFQDSQGKFSDWVELYNTTEQPVALGGFSMTDDLHRGGKWEFPSGANSLIPSRGFLLVFCDGRPELSQPGELHVSFRLAESERYPGTWDDEIILLDGYGNIADAIAFRGERTDISLGRYPDGTDLLIPMQPSPGKTNDIRTHREVFGSHHLPLIISELSADNWQFLDDTGQSFSDWLEIRNVGNAPLDLSGMKLGDSNYLKWVWSIQEKTVIQPGDHLLFFCDKAIEKGPRHTDFSLNRMGDAVCLLDRDGRVIDGIRFGPQPQNTSLGWVDGFSQPEFLNPTPGSRNMGSPLVFFLRGDANRDSRADMSDAIKILLFLFIGDEEIPCEKAADADDSGDIEITDAILIMGYIFLGGKPPAPPFPTFGPDPTPEDGLSCKRGLF
ncbi:MAG: lamin tail domain-containing protein [Planctomycetes bacterium]|nr:lamin tail domain-containing protein [Planctomycetota bacterium]